MDSKPHCRSLRRLPGAAYPSQVREDGGPHQTAALHRALPDARHNGSRINDVSNIPTVCRYGLFSTPGRADGDAAAGRDRRGTLAAHFGPVPGDAGCEVRRERLDLVLATGRDGVPGAMTNLGAA